jgi:hypothetical protein
VTESLLTSKPAPAFAIQVRTNCDHPSLLPQAAKIASSYGFRSRELAATSRRKKKFFAILDEEFQLASRMAGSTETNAATPDGAAEFPPQSS